MVRAWRAVLIQISDASGLHQTRYSWSQARRSTQASTATTSHDVDVIGHRGQRGWSVVRDGTSDRSTAAVANRALLAARRRQVLHRSTDDVGRLSRIVVFVVADVLRGQRR